MKTSIRLSRAHWIGFVFALFQFHDACKFTAVGSDRSPAESNVISAREPAFRAPQQPLSYDKEFPWYTAAEPVGSREIRSSAGSRFGVKLSDDSSKRDVPSVFDYGGIFDLDVPLETLTNYSSEEHSDEPNHRFGAEAVYSKADFLFKFVTAGFPDRIRTPLEWFARIAICAGCLYLLYKVVVIPLSPLPAWLYLRFRLSVPEAPARKETIDPRLARARMVLGVTPEAKPEQIKRAYRNLIKKYHPDAFAGSLPELQRVAHEKANELNEAYNYLTRQSRNCSASDGV